MVINDKQSTKCSNPIMRGSLQLIDCFARSSVKKDVGCRGLLQNFFLECCESPLLLLLLLRYRGRSHEITAAPLSRGLIGSNTTNGISTRKHGGAPQALGPWSQTVNPPAISPLSAYSISCSYSCFLLVLYLSVFDLMNWARL